MDECCVCLAAVPAARRKLLPCGHTLHRGCAVRWLARSRSCPLCRRPVPFAPSHLLRKAFRRRGIPRICLDLPHLVRVELAGHPDSPRVVKLAFLTLDTTRLLAALRGLQL